MCSIDYPYKKARGPHDRNNLTNDRTQAAWVNQTSKGFSGDSQTTQQQAAWGVQAGRGAVSEG